MDLNELEVGDIGITEIAEERLDWASPGRVAYGTLTILDGDPGLGKSTLLCDWAARITRGEALPGGEALEPFTVLFLSAEDSVAHTIRPRLAAAGADLKRVRVLRYVTDEYGDWDGPRRPPVFPDDIKWLDEAIGTDDAAMVSDY